MRRTLAVRLATGFGIGFAPFAPGTLGTLATLPLVWAMQFLPWIQQLLLVLLLIPPVIMICDLASRQMGEKDPGSIVLDESIGFMLAAIVLPPGIVWLIACTALFRLLDILKPWPVRQVEKQLTGGIGIVADDLLAGAICWLVIQVVYFAIGP